MRIFISLYFAFVTLSAENWPGWRGPNGDGISNEKIVPKLWSNTKNIAWKMPIQGEGHSSPIVWGDRVFLTTSLTDSNERRLLCFERLTGRLLWDELVIRSSPESIHRLNSRASSTPSTDGELVYVTFMRAEGAKVIAPNV